MKRPTTITVFGILNIVFSIFGMCGLGLAVAQPAIQQAMEQAVRDAGEEVQEDPLQKALAADPNFQLMTNISNGFGAVGTLVLLIAGIALLLMKPWGRTLSIGYSIYDILSKIVFNALIFRSMMPIIEAQEEVADGPPVEVISGIVAGGMGCGLIFGLIYPILLLVFMLRPTVASAFAAPGDGEPSDTMQILDDDQYTNPMS